jgi:hypothetical protein
MAPYGNSVVFDLPSLLSDPVLDCDNYAALVGYFVRILVPDAPNAFSVAGFDGGAVGNHAQVFLEVDEGRQVLVDPTIGLIAEQSFNDLLKGKFISAERIVVMHQHDDAQIDDFGNRVYYAIRDGKYQPSDLLYFFTGLTPFVDFSERIAPLFAKQPPALNDIVRAFPTPAALKLKQDLTTNTGHQD